MQALIPQPEPASRPQIRATQLPLMFVYLGGACCLLAIRAIFALLIEVLAVLFTVLVTSIILLIVVPVLALSEYVMVRRHKPQPSS